MTSSEVLPSVLAAVVNRIHPVDEGDIDRAWRRLDSLTKPPRSLGRLEEIAAHVAAIQRTDQPSVARKAVILAAADHGVVAEGVSAYPQEVTAQMVANFASGGAAINQLCRSVGSRVVVYDVGVAADVSHNADVVIDKLVHGTDNFAHGPAMSRDVCTHAIMSGVAAAKRLVDEGVDIIGTGEMGIGNSTSAAALTAVLAQTEVSVVTGRGTGVDDAGLRRKVDVIERGLAVNAVRPTQPFDALCSIGGLEIAALCGVMLGAAARRVPVVADGFIAGSAALCATSICPTVRDYLFASHLSAEPGHAIALRQMRLDPILVLDMRLGEGTGAALAFAVIDGACEVLSGMATFEQAGVSDSEVHR